MGFESVLAEYGLPAGLNGDVGVVFSSDVWLGDPLDASGEVVVALVLFLISSRAASAHFALACFFAVS